MSKETKIGKKKIGEEILLRLLKEGLLLANDLLKLETTKGVRQILGLEKVYKEYYPHSIKKTFNKLWRKGLVEVTETKDGYEVKLTEKGKTEVLKFDLDTLEVKKPKEWDGKWRIVFFDIAEKHKKTRDYLCKKLKSMNFHLMQDSIFIHPFDCEKEIKFLREVLGVPHEVKMGVLEKVENKEDLKRIFEPLFQ